MARRHRNSSGCGCLALLLVLPLGLTAVCAAGFALAAPTYVGYFLLFHTARFLREGRDWWYFLAAAPLLALAVVAVTGRRPVDWRRCARRAPMLLAASTVASTVGLVVEIDLRHGVDPLRFSVVPATCAAVAAAVAALYWRTRDRDPRTGPAVEPVTVEQVRKVTTSAKQTLRRVRAENDVLERLAHELDAKLAQARLAEDFHGHCHLHFTSRTCADRAHQHYTSAGRTLHTMARTHQGVEVTLRRTLVPVRGHPRPDRPAYATATTALRATRGDLDAEVERGYALLTALNQRTATFRDRIRDECGPRGQRWFADHEQRKAAQIASRA